MFELEGSPGKPPRFPFIAAALCVACVGATGWTWMRYSYVWEMTPSELATNRNEVRFHSLRDRYVYVRGQWLPGSQCSANQTARGRATLLDLNDRSARIYVIWWPDAKLLRGQVAFTGRLIGWVNTSISPPHYLLYILPNASRFHGASIAGLVVGAMGVFVFAVALRHWLGVRRKFRGEARA